MITGCIPSWSIFRGGAVLDLPIGGPAGPQTSPARFWGLAPPRSFPSPPLLHSGGLPLSRTTRHTGGLRPPPPGHFVQLEGLCSVSSWRQLGSELVSEALVAIFVFYAKSATEWCQRELWGSSVSLFPAYMDYGMLNGFWNVAGFMECKDYGMRIATPSLGAAQVRTAHSQKDRPKI